MNKILAKRWRRFIIKSLGCAPGYDPMKSDSNDWFIGWLRFMYQIATPNQRKQAGL